MPASFFLVCWFFVFWDEGRVGGGWVNPLTSLARLGSAGFKGVHHQVLLASFTIKCFKTKNNSASRSRKEVAQQLCFLTQWNTAQKRKGKDSLSSFVQMNASELSQGEKSPFWQARSSSWKYNVFFIVTTKFVWRTREWTQGSGLWWVEGEWEGNE